MNQWNPFTQSTIETVKNDLIVTMNSNKKDDDEISKKVDILVIQVSNLNKMVVDEGFVDILCFSEHLKYKTRYISIKKNIEILDFNNINIYYNFSESFVMNFGNIL